MAMHSAVLFFLGAVANTEGFRIRHNQVKMTTMKSLGIRSVMKLPWPSTLKSALNAEGSSLLDNGLGLRQPGKPLFTQTECKKMEDGWSNDLKRPDYDFMEICGAYELADREVSPNLTFTGVDVKTSKGTTLKNTWRMYTNSVLTDVYKNLLENGHIEGTNNGAGGLRTYADVIRALLDSNIDVYLFGGVVRDLARGLSANDVDIGFTAKPSEVTEAIRTKFNMGVHNYIPNVGEALWTNPFGSDYFRFGTNDTQIEGKPSDRNVFTSYLATDLSMNTLAFDVKCLSLTKSGTCYLIDKIGVGLEHALSGKMDITTPGGPENYDAADFNDWMSYNCIKTPKEPCSSLLRFLKFIGRGWQPSSKFRDLIVPVIRILFKAADYGIDWPSLHAKVESLGLAPIFRLERGAPPAFKPLPREEFQPLAPDMEKGMVGYFHHIAKPTRLASLKQAVEMAKLFQAELLLASDGICEHLPEFCEPVNEIFPAIVSFSLARFSGVYADGRGSFSNHPCGEKSTTDSIRQVGWYSWSSTNRKWLPSSKSDKISSALRAADDGACPSNIEDVEPISWATIKKNVFLCYVPSDLNDDVLEKLVKCK